jgi:hypothetical protein
MNKSPYVVGRWVRGTEHYDRQSLINLLLTAHDTAIWVVGTRRMGKTSLLRQLELVATQPDSGYVPLFWDVQGENTAEDLTRELCWALELAADLFAAAGVDVAPLLHEEDASTLLRRLSREVMRGGRLLLLLVDEAEGFMRVGEQDPQWLARLRRVLQEGNLRTIMASTRLLTQMTEQSAGWVTSPFLFGFHMVTLRPLKREGATALVRQLQSEWQVEVDDGLLEEILCVCHHHPYLIQMLCARLFTEDDTGRRYLRPIEEDDLAVDHLLAVYFFLDYQRLSEVEQRLLLAVAAAGETSEATLATVVGPGQEARMSAALRSLRELGHLRPTEQGWSVGSAFMQRWLAAHLDELRLPFAWDTPGQIPMHVELQVEDVAHLDESNIEVVAQSLGIASERLHALDGVRVQSEREFFHVVRSFFIEIRYLVEQDEGYRLLLTPGENGEPVLRSEDEIQIAIKHWLRPLCRALNVNLERESHTGRGLLDFKFSIGHDYRCLAEVKLFNSARLQEGVSVQLPTYLLADRSTYGIYVPIFLEVSDLAMQVRELHALALQRARSHGVVMDVIDIRAWRPRSASKVEDVDDPARYVVPELAGLERMLPQTASPETDQQATRRPRTKRSRGAADEEARKQK